MNFLNSTGRCGQPDALPYCLPYSVLQDALSPRTSVFLSDVETDSWPPETVQRLAAQSDRWLVTRGEFGAHEFTMNEGLSLVEPVKVCCCTMSSPVKALKLCAAHQCALLHPKSPNPQIPLDT